MDLDPAAFGYPLQAIVRVRPLSGQPVSGVVFWRCLFGALTLLVICGALGLLRTGIITLRAFGIAISGGIAI
ncbi:hypothetical protein ACC723_38160, partial [Rhizobium ruizarguesonis]